MQIVNLKLKNWLNFRSVDVPLGPRTTLIGANASGKSNFMEVLRFLRTVAQKDGGGLQQAVKDRNGMAKLRSLHARRDPNVTIEVSLSDPSTTPPTQWRYVLAIKSGARGQHRVMVAEECVERDGTVLVQRPDSNDEQDPERLTQTHLEQINLNRDFRDLSDFFAATTYLHLVPQLLKHGDMTSKVMDNDPFGQGLLQRIAATSKRVRDARLRRIDKALEQAVPLFSKLQFAQDNVTGRWHLEANFKHWRGNGAWQREDEFSDGTLRLIGLLWALQDGEGLLLLEEPELSLNTEIVRHIPLLIDRVLRDRKKGVTRQVLISTHSEALLAAVDDPGQVLVIEPGPDGSRIRAPAVDELEMMRHGLNAAEVLLPKTRPDSLEGFGLS